MTATLRMTIPFNRTVTPVEVADLFCELDNEEQADFFNAVAAHAAGWGHDFCFQLQSIIDCKRLDKGGINIMRQIGEYAECDSVTSDGDCGCGKGSDCTAWDLGVCK